MFYDIDVWMNDSDVFSFFHQPFHDFHVPENGKGGIFLFCNRLQLECCQFFSFGLFEYVFRFFSSAVNKLFHLFLETIPRSQLNDKVITKFEEYQIVITRFSRRSPYLLSRINCCVLGIKFIN